MHLYDAPASGNCYKVRLILSHLGRSYRRTEIDVLSSDRRPAEFLAANPGGRVPFLEFEDGRSLAESNAILFYVGEGTSLLPDDPFLRAQVLRWMFFEQNLLEPNIAVVRHMMMSGHAAKNRETVDHLTRRGVQTLEVMNRHLEDRTFFVDERYTIADIALYGYTHVAPEGGFDLQPWPAILAWLDRVAAQPGYVPMEA